MKKLHLTIIIMSVFLHSTSSLSQDMTEGFNALEKGDYKYARVYFENILKTYPKNLTAKICYGRSMGLSGETEKALQLFETLVYENSNNFEIGLNYAESLLWNNKYQEAKQYYELLLQKKPNNFSANLGYANTLSNLKEYEAALIYINKALEIDEKNETALISLKYIRLGKAQQHIKNKDYSKAELLLKDNIVRFSRDTETLLSLANLHIIKKEFSFAKDWYTQIKDSTEIYLGTALIAHLTEDDKKALQIATRGIAFPAKDTTKQLELKERYIQALIWNQRFKKAAHEIELFEEQFPTSLKVFTLKAMLNTYKGNFKASIENYNSLLLKDPSSFDGNLGLANSLYALGEWEKALEATHTTLKYYPEQNDALSLIKKIEQKLQTIIKSRYAYTKDNGENTAFSTQVEVMKSFSDKFQILLRLNYRKTENKVLENNAINKIVEGGFSYRIKNSTRVTARLGLLKSESEKINNSNLIGGILFETKPFPKNQLEIGYQRSVQDFNASLIQENIMMDDFIINYNLTTNFNLGWYTSVMHTSQSDANTRNLLFTSLYYNFTKKPVFKGGFNFQVLQFKEQVPELYFSPSKYQAAELFLDVSYQSQQWHYHFNIAGGYQWVEQDPATSLFRLDGSVSKRFSNGLTLGCFGKHSNISSATATGFKFLELGCILNWSL